MTPAMTTTSKKTIAIVGATGKQGGSVAETFLGLSDTWHVRAISRDPTSAAAQALRAKGAEVVRANLADKDSLAAAFHGVNAIFLNTDFWTVFYPAKAKLEAEGKDVAAASQTAFDAETSWAKNAVDAAATVPTLERLVYSALPSVSTDGKYTRSLHPEAKDWTVQYIEQQPQLADKWSVMYLGAYSQNALLSPVLDNGRYTFVSPIHQETCLPIIDPMASTGTFVRALIEDEKPGVKILAYDSNLTMREIVHAWCAASGKQAALMTVPIAHLHKMGALWEHLDAFDFINELKGDYTALVPEIMHPRDLKTKIQTKSFEQQLKERDWAKELKN